jgi:hypothetical protein
MQLRNKARDYWYSRVKSEFRPKINEQKKLEVEK